MSPRELRRGFSLVELLVVIGIIAVLIGLLMPVIGAVRRPARATACLANLQQWGQAYQMYLNANRGRSFIIGDVPARATDGTPPMWWEILQPFHPDVGDTLLCPEATEPANISPRNAFQAWGPERFWDTPTQFRGPYVGSYGFNTWLYHPRATDDGPASPAHLRLPAKEAARVPVIFDCTRLDIPALDTDEPYAFEYTGGKRAAGAMRNAAIRRHKDGINVLFLDGHADQVSRPGLWKLKWSEQFVARDVVILD